jgi:secondary thiamine-phosphate synthase enzyme
MIFQDKIKISTKGFCDIINITKQVEDIIVESDIKNGTVVVFVKGSTAGVTTIEYEEGLIKDFQEMMERLIPQNKEYHHNKKWGDGNGASHIRASLLGPSLSIPLEEGELALGTWQQIVVVDFDNRPRQREVLVQVFGEK